MVFLGGKISVSKCDEDISEKVYSESCFSRKKNNVTTTCLAQRSEQNYFDCEKKPIPPLPSS